MSDTFGYGEKTTITLASSAVAGVLLIDGLEFSRDKVKVNVLGDTNEKNRLSTILKQGDVTIKVQYSPASHTFISAVKTPVEQACVIKFYSDSVTVLQTITWAKALVQSFKITGMSEDGNVEGDLTITFNDVGAVT